MARRPDVPTATGQAGQRQGQRPIDPPHLGLIHLLHAGQHPLQRRPHPALIGRRGRCAQRRGDVVVQVGVPVEHQRARQNPGRWHRAARGSCRVSRGRTHRRPPPRRCSTAQTRPTPDWSATTGDDRPSGRCRARDLSPQQVNHLGTEQHSAARTHVGDDVAHPPPGGAAGGSPLLVGEVGAVVEDVAALRLQSEDPVVCHVFFLPCERNIRPIRITPTLRPSALDEGPSDSTARSTS